MKLGRHLITGLLVAPAVIVTLLLRKHVAFSQMMFDGGKEVLLQNICQAVIFPYMAIFIYALGRLFSRSRTDAQNKGLNKSEIFTVRFFYGCAVLILLGFALGAAGLLYKEVTILIFIIVLYVFFYFYKDSMRVILPWVCGQDLVRSSFLRNKSKASSITLFCSISGFGGGILVLLIPWIMLTAFSILIFVYLFWLSPKINTSESAGNNAKEDPETSAVWSEFNRYCIVFVRCAFLFLVGYILLAKGILIDLYSTDVMQLYFPYLQEVSRNHSI